MLSTRTEGWGNKRIEPQFAQLLKNHRSFNLNSMGLHAFDVLRRAEKFIIDMNEYNNWTNTQGRKTLPLTHEIFSSSPHSCLWIEFFDLKGGFPLAVGLPSSVRQEKSDMVPFTGIGYDVASSTLIFLGLQEKIKGKLTNNLYRVDLNRDLNAAEKDKMFSLFWYTEYLKYEHIDAIKRTVSIGPTRYRRGKIVQRHVSEFSIAYRKQPIIDNQHTAYSSESCIEWQHRWKVRGHWRRIKGIGHDTEGNEVNGFTWIKECIKGPEDKPLINRPRIFRDRLPPSFVGAPGGVQKTSV